jgi:hypothetical protein
MIILFVMTLYKSECGRIALGLKKGNDELQSVKKQVVVELHGIKKGISTNISSI